MGPQNGGLYRKMVAIRRWRSGLTEDEYIFCFFVQASIHRNVEDLYVMDRVDQVSISPTFHDQLFHIKVYFIAFLYSQFGFIIFCQKNINAKASCEKLMKLTTVRLGRINQKRW
jgi:hypothetical protein